MNMSALKQVFRNALVIIATCLALASANADPKLRFEVTEIVPTPESLTVYPLAMNIHGEVVGAIGDNWPIQPFKYHNGVFDILPFEEAVATDINDAGDFIISGSSGGYLVRAGVVTPLQSNPDRPFNARGLNNHGVVVGSVSQSFLLSYAASWSNGVVRHLSPISGHSASDISDSGVAVGTMSQNTVGLVMAAMFRDGQAIPLGTLPGHVSSDATAINSRGEILGRAYSSEGIRTFLFRAGTMLDLGTLPGATTIHGTALNNLGHVVGYSWDAQRRERAFLYMDGGLHDLTEFIKPNTGWTFLTANAINDKGQIAGVGQINGGPPRAFLLTPKKEPRTDFGFKPPRGVFPGLAPDSQVTRSNR